MFSPSGGALAELAAVPGLTPATSLAPLSAEPPATAAKRSRAGARSVPPSLTLAEGSPARHGRALPDVSVSPGQPAFEARMLLAFDELQKNFHQLAFNANEERGADRTRIAFLEQQSAAAFKDAVTYADKANNTLRAELSEFSARVDELTQSSINSVANLAGASRRTSTQRS